MKSILEAIADGVFTVDRDWRITFFNRAAEQITGVRREFALNRYCFEVFKSSICEQGCWLRNTMETGRPNVRKTAYVVLPTGHRLPISVSTGVLRDGDGRVVGGVETFRDLSVVEALRDELGRSYRFGDMVSKNQAMHAIFDVLPQIALSDTAVLIEGESGTGKELLARAIHAQSGRSRGPWVTVNCGALPETLLESELFGHVAGAFTGATRGRDGRFAAADRGTIFLDEVGDMSPALQVKLLRVLQDKTIEPIGSSKPREVNVRVLAATNKRLRDLLARGTFREDLFYRLKVVTLRLPPLRERRDDIGLLVEHFLRRFNTLEDKEFTDIDAPARAALLKYDFPGNIRELSNIIEHAFVLCPEGTIRLGHLPETLCPQTDRSGPAGESMARALAHLEADVIRSALERHGNSRTAAARELGIHKTTLWRKMKKLRIRAP